MLNRQSLLLVLLAGLFLVPAVSFAAEPEVDAKDLPRIPATEPDDALKTFRLKKGFKLELVAAEPLVVDPIEICFDENSRMFVLEMRGYSERRGENLGRVRALEDKDNDGKYETSTVYADNLAWPTAMIYYDGGLFVGATPDLLYFKDTNGDGVADERKVVFTGFGVNRDRLNVQALLNSFRWTLDNRIHGATAPNGGQVVPVNSPAAETLDLRGRDFSFDPRTLSMRAESGGAQYGLSFNNRGRKFVSSNSHHLQTLMYEARYAARNPFHAMPGALVDIAVDGPAAEVYRISPDEPWRVIRTKWRVAGVVSGPVEGGGRVSGYFTGATGATIYRGTALGPDYVDDAFVGDAGGNLVHHKDVRMDGIGVLAERPPDERKVEFLASTDNWFRPVQFANAPDGALYVIDMYREVIEHPWSLPESIKKHLDLNSGNDRGRIYRVVAESFKQPPPQRPGKATTAQLIATLAHPNGWHRDTAARLLYERQDETAPKLLVKFFETTKSPLGRMHALYALAGQNALTEATILRGLKDSDELVREHAVRLSDRLFAPTGGVSDALWRQLQSMTADPSIRVRYQLAFTLGEISRGEKLPALATILRRDLANSWMQAAVLSSVAEQAGELFTLLKSDAGIRNSSDGQAVLRQLVVIAGTRNNSTEVRRMIERIANTTDPRMQLELTRALADGLQRGGSSLAAADSENRLARVFTAAVGIAVAGNFSEADRERAVQLLGYRDEELTRNTLLALLGAAQSQVIQSAAITALGRLSGPEVSAGLIRNWNGLTPALREEALKILLARPDRARALLSAIEAGTMRRAEVNSTQVKFLRNHNNSAVRQQAEKVFSSAAATPSRQEAIDTYLPALNLAGNAANGRIIFLGRCSTCHRLGSEGYALGPDLKSVKASGKETMLVNIVDPNREVPPNYMSYVIETKDGESLIGLVANETGASLTVRQAAGFETVVLRSNIESMQSQGQSVMPEGLEAGMTPQDMADLIEYIVTAQPAQ